VGSGLRILGIDPGSDTTGFGVISRNQGELCHVTHGVLRLPPSASLALRLETLYRELRELVARHHPDVAVVEQVFVAASPRSALVLGQARGVALAALAGGGVSVHEYAPARIKQALTGSGRASKLQIRTLVQRLLALPALPGPDSADALAAAICHARASRLEVLGVATRTRRRRPRAPGLRLAVRPVR
jgi:crossover junction endodeoxyribonuclease RuvC